MNKKLIAGITLATLFSVGALSVSPASALTVDEIQTQIKELFAKIADLQKLLASTNATSTASTAVASSVQHRVCAILNRNLARNTSGDDVMSLQEFLRDEGYLSANATGYFGPATAAAVAKWQSAEGISAVGSIGPLSRERIKIWCGAKSDLSASPARGAAPLAVEFTYQPQGEEGQYYIDFGDGGGQLMDTRQIYCIRAPCVSPAVASHTYRSPGTYTATVSRYIACLHTEPRCLLAEPPPLARAKVVVLDPSSASNKPPVVSGFSGPTSLTLNETGTWTITASDPENGPLSYAISWGDEWQDKGATRVSSAASSIQQETTFTHSYARAGSYRVTVVVTDSAGKEAKTSSSVQVSNSQVACTLEYNPVCGRPPGCTNTCPPGQFCTAICRLPDPVTYGNRCQLNAANAEFLYAGACAPAQSSSN
ncbi:MAG: PKD domain-containing protein [Candidatus Kaiserbacteria bacterium]|nr:MAG: PKD domain-containing protein [Candidatus Kaiserbacteria bacterium]